MHSVQLTKAVDKGTIAVGQWGFWPRRPLLFAASAGGPALPSTPMSAVHKTGLLTCWGCWGRCG